MPFEESMGGSSTSSSTTTTGGNNGLVISLKDYDGQSITIAGTVADRITDINTITEAALSGAAAFLNALQASLNITIPFITQIPQADFKSITISVTASAPSEPTLTDLDLYKWVSPNALTLPADPAMPNLDGYLAYLGNLIPNTQYSPPPDPPSRGVTVDAPEFTDTLDVDDITVGTIAIEDFTETAPVINEPTPPDPLNVNPPDIYAPQNINIPTIPEYPLPAIPVLTDYVIPDPPSFVIPEFDGILPDFDIVEPDTNFEFHEVEYQSALLDAVKAKLLNDVVNGGTGLGADIETAIWERKQERDEIAMNESIDTLIDTWASRNFPLPNGDLNGGIQEILEKQRLARIDSSRDISIEQANLAQKNTQFSIEKSITLEQILIQHSDNVAERGLKAALATVEMSIAVFNSRVAWHNAKLERYKVEHFAYESRIKVEMLKADIYKVMIEATKARGDIQMHFVELYKAQIEGIQALIGIWKLRMEGAQLEENLERAKLDASRVQIEAFSSLINAKTAEYGMYKAKWEGEAQKVNIFESKVRAFTATTEAKKALADILIAQANADIQVQKNKIDIYQTNANVFKIEADVAFERARTTLALIDSDIKYYDSQVRGEEVRVRADVDIAKASAEIVSSVIRGTSDAYTAKAQTFKAIADARIAEFQVKISELKYEAEAIMSKAQALTAVYQAKASIYQTEVALARENANIQVENIKYKQQIELSNTQFKMQTATQNLEAFIKIATLEMEAARGGSQIYSALVSSAMQALHASVGLSGSSNTNYNYSGEIE